MFLSRSEDDGGCKRRMACFICPMLLTSLIYRSEGANMNVRYRLHKTLLDPEKYDNDLRPVNDSGDPVVVTFEFQPILHHVDLAYQELQLRSKMAMTWFDERLTWNRDDYGGLHHVDLPLHKVWKPDVTLYERLAKHSDDSFKLENALVKVLYNGNVNWTTVVTTRSFCLMKVANFPFDNHLCYLSFLSMVYDEKEQKLVVTLNENFHENEVEHADWKLNITVDNDSRKYCPKGFSNITYEISLVRLKPFWIFVSLVLPCYAVAFMSFYVLIFQDDVSDAAGFGLTCILALVVFLSGFYDILPGTGFTFIGLYVVCTILLGMMMTLIALCRPRKQARYRNSIRRGDKEETPLDPQNDQDNYGTEGNDGHVEVQTCKCWEWCKNSKLGRWFFKQYSTCCLIHPVRTFLTLTVLWVLISLILSVIMFSRQ